MKQGGFQCNYKSLTAGKSRSKQAYFQLHYPQETTCLFDLSWAKCGMNPMLIHSKLKLCIMCKIRSRRINVPKCIDVLKMKDLNVCENLQKAIERVLLHYKHLLCVCLYIFNSMDAYLKPLVSCYLYTTIICSKKLFLYIYIYIYIYIYKGAETGLVLLVPGTTNNSVNVIQNGLKIIH